MKRSPRNRKSHARTLSTGSIKRTPKNIVRERSAKTCVGVDEESGKVSVVLGAEASNTTLDASTIDLGVGESVVELQDKKTTLASPRPVRLTDPRIGGTTRAQQHFGADDDDDDSHDDTIDARSTKPLPPRHRKTARRDTELASAGAGAGGGGTGRRSQRGRPRSRTGSAASPSAAKSGGMSFQERKRTKTKHSAKKDRVSSTRP